MHGKTTQVILILPMEYKYGQYQLQAVTLLIATELKAVTDKQRATGLLDLLVVVQEFEVCLI
jgi:hypothetical protein